MDNAKNRRRIRSAGKVVAFRPTTEDVRKFLVDFAVRENRTVSNAVETLLLNSPEYQAWCEQRSTRRRSA